MVPASMAFVTILDKVERYLRSTPISYKFGPFSSLFVRLDKKRIIGDFLITEKLLSHPNNKNIASQFKNLINVKIINYFIYTTYMIFMWMGTYYIFNIFYT